MKLISEGENTLVVLGLCSDVNDHKHMNTEVLYSVATYHGVNLHLKILLVYSTLIVCLLLTRKLLKLKSLLRKFYGRSHDLINRYRISVSQMTTHMFHLQMTTHMFHLYKWNICVVICDTDIHFRIYKSYKDKWSNIRLIRYHANIPKYIQQKYSKVKWYWRSQWTW